MRQESGTEAERLAYDTTGLPVLSTWEVTSGSGQGNKYTWGGSAWVQTHSGGAALVTDGALAVIIVSTGGYTYIAEAHPGSDATAAVWRCQKIDEATGTTTWADGNGNFDNIPGAAGAGLSALTYL